MKVASLSTSERIECDLVSLMFSLLITSDDKRSKNQHQLTEINRDINKEVFFHLNEFVELTIETVVLREKIMLRSRLENEYVTSSHWHDLNRIELNSSTDLASSSISRISSTSMIMFKSLATRNRKWAWNLRRRFYKWVFNKLVSRTTWVWSVVRALFIEYIK